MYYTVYVDINKDELEGLYPSMTARAVIKGRESVDALTVPVTAIRSDSEGSYVYVKEGADVKKTYVTTGISTEKEIEVKVYSNQNSVALYADGKKLAEQTGEHIFRFRVPLHGKVELKAVAGDCIDTASFCNVAEPNPSYKLVKTKSKSANWV